MSTMAENRSTSRLGNILRTVGFLWLALFFVGNLIVLPGAAGRVLAFFTSNLILPIILIFAGRVIGRRARREELEDGLGSTMEAPIPMPSERRRTPSVSSPKRTLAGVERREAAVAREHEQADAARDALERVQAIEQLLEEEMAFQPKTSEEMIAEAHLRWNRAIPKGPTGPEPPTAGQSGPR